MSLYKLVCYWPGNHVITSEMSLQMDCQDILGDSTSMFEQVHQKFLVALESPTFYRFFLGITYNTSLCEVDMLMWFSNTPRSVIADDENQQRPDYF